MNRKLLFGLGIVAIGAAVLIVLLVAVIRVKESRQYSQKHRVQNYVVQLLETTVGKIETGSVVIVYVRLENPNPVELVVARETFRLDGCPPVTDGTQTALIKLPANGVLEKEALSYAVGDDAFAGPLALEVGQDQLVVKNAKPWTQRLPAGQFVTFRRRDW